MASLAGRTQHARELAMLLQPSELLKHSRELAGERRGYVGRVAAKQLQFGRNVRVVHCVNAEYLSSDDGDKTLT